MLSNKSKEDFELIQQTNVTRSDGDSGYWIIQNLTMRVPVIIHPPTRAATMSGKVLKTYPQGQVGEIINGYTEYIDENGWSQKKYQWTNRDWEWNGENIIDAMQTS